jgi:predicted amidohydrolase YtcJ
MDKARLILKNGNILTMAASERARAVAVGRDGRIIAVGSDDQVTNLANAETEVINLWGQTLIPGFFDCHLHIGWLGLNLGHVNLASPPVQDKHDIIRLLRERLMAQPDLPCVQGNRYDQNKLIDGRHLTRTDLDQVSTTVPVRIVHTSGHAAVVNSVALQRLGVTRETPDPLGGEIERGVGGEPTGVLLETASWSGLDRILPEPTLSEQVEAMGRANRYLLERGIASATDANTRPGDVAAYARAVSGETLQVRVNLMVGWAEVLRQAGDGSTPTPQELQPVMTEGSRHRLHVGQAKLFADGAITTRTCWLTSPFLGMPDNYGLAQHAPDELSDSILRAHLAGWQIATHAIGDRAIDLVLSAYADAQRRHTRPRPDHRIEHCMLLDAGLIARLRRQNVWSIGQPEFLSSLGDAYIAALGEARADRLSPYATLDAQGVAQAFSSDCPVVPGAPLDGLRAAMERRTPRGRILNAGERIAADSALYAYTAAPAYATRTERDRGTIEAGKWADFTLLSADPTAISTGEQGQTGDWETLWDRLKVLATFIGGDCLYGEKAVA